MEISCEFWAKEKRPPRTAKSRGGAVCDLASIVVDLHNFLGDIRSRREIFSEWKRLLENGCVGKSVLKKGARLSLTSKAILPRLAGESIFFRRIVANANLQMRLTTFEKRLALTTFGFESAAPILATERPPISRRRLLNELLIGVKKGKGREAHVERFVFGCFGKFLWNNGLKRLQNVGF